MRQESEYVYGLITIHSDLTPGATRAPKTESMGRDEDTQAKNCVLYIVEQMLLLIEHAPFPHPRFSASIKHDLK